MDIDGNMMEIIYIYHYKIIVSSHFLNIFPGIPVYIEFPSVFLVIHELIPTTVPSSNIILSFSEEFTPK